MRRRDLAAVVAVTAALFAAAPGRAVEMVRFATFNAALTEDEAGALVDRLAGGEDRSARLVAETIQRARPHVLALQEIDRDADGRALAIFLDEYLAVGQNGADPITFAHVVHPPSNTGVASGLDLDGDGRPDGPEDALGFGHHRGQYAFALLSRLPLGPPRTFRTLKWADMPGSLLPRDFYPPEALAVLPVSSKTHLVVPVKTAAGPIAAVVAHPTPPVFDDEAIDWNGRRNADEIRLIADILDPVGRSYLVDDHGTPGGLAAEVSFVVMGDLNADPARGESRPGAIERLLTHERVRDVAPRGSEGTATASFGGGMRVDYVLPSTDLAVGGSGVFWPAEGSTLGRLNAASDHRLVWVDVALDPAAQTRPSRDLDRRVRHAPPPIE